MIRQKGEGRPLKRRLGARRQARKGTEGRQVGEKRPPKRQAERSGKDTGSTGGQGRGLRPRGLHVHGAPPGAVGGELKMKHLVSGPRDVTLDRRGLGRLPRGNGRVPGVGGGSPTPTPAASPQPRARENERLSAQGSRGAPVPPRGQRAQLARWPRSPGKP